MVKYETKLSAALLALTCLLAVGCGPAAKPLAPPPLQPFEDALGPAPQAELSGVSYVVRGKRYQILASVAGYEAEGMGAWYGGKNFQGRKTASGEIFDQNQMTAAHRTLPFGSLVEVRNISNGQTVVVRINDRGPFDDNYVIDLARAAAMKIGLLSSGLVAVRAAENQQCVTD